MLFKILCLHFHLNIVDIQ